MSTWEHTAMIWAPCSPTERLWGHRFGSYFALSWIFYFSSCRSWSHREHLHLSSNFTCKSTTEFGLDSLIFAIFPPSTRIDRLNLRPHLRTRIQSWFKNVVSDFTEASRIMSNFLTGPQKSRFWGPDSSDRGFFSAFPRRSLKTWNLAGFLFQSWVHLTELCVFLIESWVMLAQSWFLLSKLCVFMSQFWHLSTKSWECKDIHLQPKAKNGFDSLTFAFLARLRSLFLFKILPGLSFCGM